MSITSERQIGVVGGEFVNNLVHKVEDVPSTEFFEKYYMKHLMMVKRGEEKPHLFRSYAEATKEFKALLNRRIDLQLQLRDKTDEKAHMIVVPFLVKVRGGARMTEAQIKAVEDISDDESPITKRLDEKGWAFATEVFGNNINNITMMMGIVVVKHP